jgi:hypothetical protein
MPDGTHQHPPDNGPAKRLAGFEDPVVVGIAGGHGGAAPCALTDGEALVAVPADLLVVDPVLDPPGDADDPEAPGTLVVGTLRGSQPKAIEHVGFAEFVKKLVAPGFCCPA